MKPATDSFERRDQIIAALLWYGTWFASAVIGVGVLLTAFEPLPASLSIPITGYETVKAGVAVFILLPIARVALMLSIFLREKDYTYTIISALVLAIIATGVLIEI
ncbi:DUF1634 domain-containing protein [Ochrobactrum sp. CM-21-5]|nr:DUF1634 domain-containing protein [Ochrobactrum sp. CM-21-5]MBC2885464.1 DUF1634 domain-containing protein [Ochrobactrum sp. CM-21-5]